MRRAIFTHLIGICIFFGSFVFGVWLNRFGFISWDDSTQYGLSLGIISRYGLWDAPFPSAHNQYYALFWELFLGICTKFVFHMLNDPFVVRHALTFALYPFTFFWVYCLLRRIGVHRSTSIISLAILFSVIRFGGHALMNVKDFPAAAFFLLSSIWIWVLFYEMHNNNFFAPGKLISLGCVAALPFLGRVPLILHFVILISLLTIYASCVCRNISVLKRILLIAIPLCSGAALILAFYSPFWTMHLEKWLIPFRMFNSFDVWIFTTKIFGRSFLSNNIPWWYIFGWIPVLIHPIGLLCAFFGALALLSGSTIRFTIGHSVHFSLFGREMSISLVQWLAFVVIISWGMILVVKPALYDEERHILFLYPPLFLLCGLGLDFLHKNAKCAIALVLIVTSGFSYLSWQEYSYVYKSSIIGNIQASQFMGDYWGLCFSRATISLQDHVPPNTIVFSSLNHLVMDQVNRLHTSLLSTEADFPVYRYTGGIPNDPYVRIHWNREGNPRSVLRQSDQEPTMFWWNTMPPGEPACFLAYYYSMQQ